MYKIEESQFSILSVIMTPFKLITSFGNQNDKFGAIADLNF